MVDRQPRHPLAHHTFKHGQRANGLLTQRLVSRWLVLFLLVTAPVVVASCSLDAVVFAVPSSANTDADSAQGGYGGVGGIGAQAGAGGRDEPGIYGCRAAGQGGAQAVFDRVVDMTAEVGGWLRRNQSCSNDGDCRTALLTPACNTDAELCMPCSDSRQRMLYTSRLVTCLASAIARCCVDPEAPQDCVFRDCVGGCGPQ